MPNWLNRPAIGFAYQNLEKVNSLAGLLSPTVSGYLHQSLEVVLLPPGLQSPTVVNRIFNSRPMNLDLHLPGALPARARATSAGGHANPAAVEAFLLRPHRTHRNAPSAEAPAQAYSEALVDAALVALAPH